MPGINEPVAGVVRNHRFLKDDYNPKATGVNKIPAHDLNWYANLFNTLQVRGGQLILTPDGKDCVLIIGDPLSGLDFAFRVQAIDATHIYVNPGKARIAAEPWVQYEGTIFEVTASGTVYIVLEIMTKTFSALQYGVEPEEEQDGDTTVFALADVTVGLDSNGHPVIGGVFGRRLGDIDESKV